MESFKVCSKMCKNCLFSKNKIVSDERSKELIEEIINEDSYFVCHQSSYQGGSVCCRAFYNLYRFDSFLLRLANLLKIVEFVEIDFKETLTPYDQQIKIENEKDIINRADPDIAP